MSALSLPPNLPPNWPGAGGSRADLGAAGTYYRAFVGPLRSAEEVKKVAQRAESCRRRSHDSEKSIVLRLRKISLGGLRPGARSLFLLFT
jgi:hypothetical protein